MRKMLPASKKFVVSILGLLTFLTFFANPATAQVDTEFWFAVPYVNVHHGLDNEDAYNAGEHGGAKPLKFVVASLDEPAIVRIEIPATGEVLATLDLAANETQEYVVPDEDRPKIIVSREGNIVEDKGVRITSSSLITAYYENATIQNPDLFALKGRNALGYEFYTPFQNLWPNDPKHNANKDDVLKYYTKVEGYSVPHEPWWIEETIVFNTEGLLAVENNDSIWLTPDSAFSAFDIVATEHGTVIEITPSTDIVGHAKGETFEVVLNKGQTYSARAVNQGVESTEVGYGFEYPTHWRSDPQGWQPHDSALVVHDNKDVDNLSGSHIVVKSGGKIAVTIKDDSVFENDETNSFSGGCEDFLGDQIVPIDVIGTEYIIMKGQLNYIGVKEYAFVLATEDGTTLEADGVDLGVSLAKGETYVYEICEDASCDFSLLKANKNIYVLQTTGYECELAASILPPVNLCTGSQQVGFTRTYGGKDNQNFFMNLMVRNVPGALEGFQFNDEDGNNSNSLTYKLRNNTDGTGTLFDAVGDDWLAARIPLSNQEVPVAAHIIKNSTTLFHMSFISSTSYSWSNGNYVLTGSEFGYFSNYDASVPYAFIRGSRNVTQDSIYVAEYDDVEFVAEGGVSYLWHDLQKKNASGVWENLDLSNLSPDVSSNLTLEEVFYNSISPLGEYKLTVDVENDCYEKDFGVVYSKDLYVFVEKMYPPYSFTDTVCEIAVGSKTSIPMNLYVPVDSILRKEALDGGDYVSGWYEKTEGDTTYVHDFENDSVFLAGMTAFNSPGVIVDNPNTLYNSSFKVMHVQKNAGTGIDVLKQRSAHVEYEFAEPYNIEVGKGFAFQYRYDGEVLVDPSNNGLNSVFVSLVKDGAEVERIDIEVSADDVSTPVWISDTVWFSETITEADITHFRFGLISAFDYPNAPYGFYFDNFELLGEDYYTQISDVEKDSTSYVFDHPSGDNVVYARVQNDRQYRDEYVPQYVHVNETGRQVNHLVDSVGCITEGGTFAYDLYDWKYKVKDAVFPNIHWYADKELTDRILETDPRFAGTITDSTTFYAAVIDNCNRVGTVTFDLVPIPEVQDLTDELCANQLISPTQVEVDLTAYQDQFIVSSTATWEYTWYSDEARTVKIVDPTSVLAEGVQEFYVNINKQGRYECAAEAVLEIDVKPLPPFVFPDSTFCDDDDKPFTLEALPSGGVFTIEGAEYTDFVLTDFSGQTVEVVYEIVDGSCPWKDTAIYTVHDAPVITIPLIDSIKFGDPYTIDGSVANGSGDFTYTWSNLMPKNVFGDLTVEDLELLKFYDSDDFTLTLEDNVTGCNDTAKVHAKVWGAPLSVAITTPDTPLCQYNDADLRALIIGGAGPYSLEWSTGDTRGSSLELHDTITVTPTVTTEYFVTVTDHGDFDKQKDTSIVITVYENPEINTDVYAGNIPVCQNSPLTIDGSATGGNGDLVYSWTGDNLLLLSNNEIATPDFNSTEAIGEYAYRLKVTDELNCMDTVDVVVEIKELPELGLDTEYEVCSGHVLDITATTTKGLEGYSWEWAEQTDNLSDITGETVVFNNTTLVADVDTIKVKVTDANTCSDSTVVYVTTNILPIPVYTGHEDGVCNDESITLTGTPSTADYSYVWKSNANSSLSTESTYDFDLSTAVDSVEITFVVTDVVTGCTDSIMDSVVVHPLPEVAIDNDGDLEICKNAELELHATATSAVGIQSYVWTVESPATLDRLDSAYVVFKGADAGDYAVDVTVTDSNLCVSSSASSVEILDRPSYTKPTETLLCSTLDYDLDLEIQDGFVVTWTGDTAIIKNKSIPAQPRIYAKTDGEYKLYYNITDGECTSDDSVEFTVNLRPIVSVEDVLVCAGVDTEAEAVLSYETKDVNTSFDWSIDPDGPATLPYSNTVPDVYDFSVIAQAVDYNCTDTADFTITVFENPVAEIKADVSDNKIIDNQPGTTVVAWEADLSLHANVTGGKANYTYVWTPTDSIASSDTYTITHEDFRSVTLMEYELTVIDANGCEDVVSRSFISNAPFITIYEQDCAGGTISEDDPQYVKPTCPNVSDKFKVCQNESINLTPVLTKFGNDNDYEYTWYIVTEDNPTDTLPLNLKNNPNGYIPLNSVNGVDDSLHVTLIVAIQNSHMAKPVLSEINGVIHLDPIPMIKVLNTEIVQGNDVSLVFEIAEISNLDGKRDYSYSWRGDLTSGVDPADLKDSKFTYDGSVTSYNPTPGVIVEITDNESGCVKADGAEFKAIRVENGEICEGGEAYYRVYGLPSVLDSKFNITTFNGPQDFEYVKYVPNDTIEKRHHLYKAQWPVADNYAFVVYNDVANTENIVFGDNVSQNVKPTVEANIYGPADVCVGDSAVYDIGNLEGVWTLQSFEGNMLDPEDIDPLTNEEIAVSERRIRWDSVGVDSIFVDVAEDKCLIDDILYVTIHDNPKAGFDYEPKKDIIKDDEVTFINLSEGEDANSDLNFYWDFAGDGIYTSEQEEPIYQFTGMGTYEVNLIVEDADFGCVDTAKITVVVDPNPLCNMTYPNTVIPGHDNPRNRYFYSRDREGITEVDFKLRVFNEWGALVWETSDPEAEWDCYYNNSLVQQGNYVFQSTATCENGEKININGDITIIR